ncbi:MAG: DNA polymerase I [Ktedonobacterales bacterium]
MSSGAQPMADIQPAGKTTTPDARPLLVLIDGHALYHRSFHAFPDEISTSRGEPTNAIFGFTRMLLDVLRMIQPEYLLVTFDRPTPTFRHVAYAPYKAHRPPLPEGLRAQFPRVREVIRAFNIPIYEEDGFEADDLLGTLSLQAKQRQVHSIIATGDLDTLQLVDDWVRVTFARSPRRGEFDYFDREAVIARYGFEPQQLVDFKALVGDTSDNIPGVAGIGAKTATKLINQYGSLEAILAHVDELAPRLQALLTEDADLARECKYLATIVRDVPVSLDLEGARSLRYNADEVLGLFRELEFHTLVDKLPRAVGLPAVVVSSTAAEPVTTAQTGRDLVVGEERSQDDQQLSLFSEEEMRALAEQDTNIPQISLMAKLEPVASLPATPEGGTNTLIVDRLDTLDVLIHSLKAASIFSLDLETDTVDEMNAKIVGISCSMGAGEAYYIPIGHSRTPDGALPDPQLPQATVLDMLRPVLSDEDSHKVGHNAKYDMMVLARHGIDLGGLRFDTMVGAYLLNPGRRNLGLKELAFEQLGIIMSPISDLIGTGKRQITMAEVPIRLAADYAGADADMTLRLMQRLEPNLRERDLASLMNEVEVPLIPVLASMELAGILVDKDFLRRMGRDLDLQLDALEKDIYGAVGHQFNISSPKQLGDVLFGELRLPHGRKTKTGYSVDAEVLEGLRGQHPAVDTLLEYRQLNKLKTQYVDGLLELVNPSDGRVHTSFNQTIASTGRLSSSNPNLQNIPVRTEVGRRIRRAFLADAGYYLLMADYSQIELRILAHITHEPELVAAFEQDQDIHAATAARLFNVGLKDVTPEQRRLAKTVNFGVLYGQSAFGLANTASISNSEAAAFIRNYESSFPRVRDYIQTTLHQARTRGYVQTLLGRKRYIQDMAQLPVVARQAAEREAINMPIQGTNADMIKIAMIRLHRRLQEVEPRARLILQVHDELVLEVPDSSVDPVSELVREAMVNALPLHVPVKVEMKLGRNWYEVEAF